VKESAIAAEKVISLLPFSLLFALSNSFVEESITRLGVVIILADKIDESKISSFQVFFLEQFTIGEIRVAYLVF
jgi:hypothetical protein